MNILGGLVVGMTLRMSVFEILHVVNEHKMNLNVLYVKGLFTSQAADFCSCFSLH